MATSNKKILVSTKVRKWMSLSELEDSGDKGPVWVLNSMTGELNGQLLINVPKKHGNGNDLVKVPKTFIPIDLTDQVPKGQLLEASEFRKTVSNGLVKLISSEYANILLASEEGKEESRKIKNEMAKTKTIIDNAGIKDSADTEDDFVTVEEAQQDARKAKAKAGGGKASASIKLMTAVNSGIEAEENEKGILARIRTYAIGADLTVPDIRWLHAKLGDKPRIKKYLKEQYDELKAATT